MVQAHGIGRARVDEVIDLVGLQAVARERVGGLLLGTAGTRPPGGALAGHWRVSAGGRGQSPGDRYEGARARDLDSDGPACRAAWGWAAARGDARVVRAPPQLDRAHGNSR
jgi:hypothetical protein